MFFDKVYSVLFSRFIRLISIIINIIEKKVINKIINFFIDLSKTLGLLFSSLQTGRFYHYLGIGLFSIVIVVMFLICI